MQRIPTLVQKLHDLSKTDGDKISVIDIDLMLDYTRVLYADLLEWRTRIQFSESVAEPAQADTASYAEPETVPMPTSSAPSVELTSQVQSYDLPEEKTASGTTGLVDSGDGDVRKRIGINDKYQFISELFGNDKEAYEQALNHVNNFNSYEQAVEWLDEHVHTKYGWNDEDLAVQSFYDTLNNFFASR
jgi:hypothetical protein